MIEGSRVKNSIRNSFWALVTNLIVLFAGFICQRLFLRMLSLEYVGLNSLFLDILNMLNLAEIGIGSAIIFKLYKPISENNTQEINSLMGFYRKCYYVIGFVVTIVGIIIIPFLPWIIGEIQVEVFILIVYLLFLSEMVASYFFSYKRSLLYANQKNYIINIIHIIYVLSVNTVQLLILYTTKSYYLYLVIRVVFRILENIVISIYVDKIYGKCDYKNIPILRKELKDDIFIKVKSMIYHKAGDFVIAGTTNIVISRFLGVLTVGLYANYRLITMGLYTVISQFINALTPSVGNMIVTSDYEKCFKVFKRIRFINFWIVSFSGITLLMIMESFISIWIGEQYLFTRFVLIILIFLFYQINMRCCYIVFKDAVGIYYEDRFIPLINAIANISLSVIFVQIFGLAGVFLGRILSDLILHLYSYPKYIYARLFHRSPFQCIKETIGYFSLFSVMVVLYECLFRIIMLSNKWLDIIAKGVVSIVGINLILLIIFHKRDECKYLFNIIIKKIKRYYFS